MSGNPAGSQTRSVAWTYDKNNNRLTQSSTIGAGTAQTTAWTYQRDNSIATQDGPIAGTSDQHTFTYNDAGLLTADACSTYTYDTFDRIATNAVNNTTECGSDSHTTTYSYDGLDRQRTSAVTGSSKTGWNTTTKSVYDGLTTALVGQVNAVNGSHSSPTDLYQLDPTGTAVAYSQTQSAAGTAFLDTDGHGNITALTTGDGTSTGALGCGVVYDAYGTPQQLPTTGTSNNGVCENNNGSVPTTSGNAIWYRGQTRDASSGTYQLGTRTYNPATGSLTSPDAYRVATPATDLSVGTDPQTTNTYAYVNGNPLNLIDPDGHRPISGDGTEVNYCNWHSCNQNQKKSEASFDLSHIQSEAKDHNASISVAKARSTKSFDYRKALVNFGLSMIGWDDLKGCLNGSWMGCGMTLLNLGGPALKVLRDAGKAIKIIRDIEHAADAFRAAKDADKLLLDGDKAWRLSNEADEAAELKRLREAEGEPDSVENCLLHSFAPDTDVVMANGTRKAIAKIKVGDKVLAHNLRTGRNQPAQVTRLWRNHDNDLRDLTVANPRNRRRIVVHTTDHHPFYSLDRHTWIAASELHRNEHLREADGTGLMLATATVSPGATWMNDLTIGHLHDYYIAVHHETILVHNNNGCGAANHVDDILPTPQVGSTKLQNLVNNLYKGTTNPNRVGNGTTMDAIRNEIATGVPTGGRMHTIKGQETLRGLNNWLRRNPDADYYDRLVAQSLADELSTVLRGAP